VCGADGAVTSSCFGGQCKPSHIYDRTDSKEAEVAATEKKNSIVSTFGVGKPQNLETCVIEFSITTKEGMNIALVAMCYPKSLVLF